MYELVKSGIGRCEIGAGLEPVTDEAQGRDERQRNEGSLSRPSKRPQVLEPDDQSLVAEQQRLGFQALDVSVDDHLKRPEATILCRMGKRVPEEPFDPDEIHRNSLDSGSHFDARDAKTTTQPFQLCDEEEGWKKPFAVQN